jgi:hypothetical protein
MKALRLVAVIALGYSLLRFPYNLHGLLWPYAQAQIAAGVGLAAPPLAGLWPWPAALAHVLLGLLLYRAATRPAVALAVASPPVFLGLAELALAVAGYQPPDVRALLRPREAGAGPRTPLCPPQLQD